ncbi:MAG: MG2 domain-containing protein, partial [Planctomycetota bacterium]|nr:MG2 domain-containing protein [Planctomycetota bacterium]
MKTLCALLVLASLSVSVLPQDRAASDPGDYEELKRKAELHFAEGSFELAHRLYKEADELELEPDEARWVDFRVADTRWRTAAASNNPDDSELATAFDELGRLAALYQRNEDHNRLWAEIQESLGDYYWDNQRTSNWGAGWGHYQPALDFWAHSRDIELAREHYLAIVWRASQPSWWQSHWDYGYYGNNLPENVLRNAVKIARGDEDTARAHFLLGMHRYRSASSNEERARAVKDFEAVLELGQDNRWYDDALFNYGRFSEDYGRFVRLDNGAQQWKQDYVLAVRLYRTLMRGFRKGETRYWDQAAARVKAITGPDLGLSVNGFFLPDSEVQYYVNWRNVDRVDLSLHPVDLTRDVRITGNDPDSWLSSIRLDRLETQASWTHETDDQGDHQPGSATLVLAEKPATGAYVLVARAGGQSRRALVLVSDASIVVKNAGQRMLAWFTDVQSGKPIAGADLKLWERYYGGNEWRYREVEGVTGEDGTKLFELKRSVSNTEYFLAAKIGDRQAYSQASHYHYRTEKDRWRVYAFTDRPAYRPLDTVAYKVVARTSDGSVYATPEGEKLKYTLRDPRGEIVSEGELSLNAFGAAWGEVETDEDMPLGEYRVEFRSRGNYIGQATLFRLEEYKLPEFEVGVSLPRDEETGGPRLFRVGDRVEAEIRADYYFGGPVANAEVEVLVYQRPYYHTWRKKREYSWLYQETQYNNWWGGPGQLVTHEKIKTDLAGIATIGFDTPVGVQQDYEYTIEARVVDGSRREVVSSQTVRVTRQAYYVRVAPEHRIHRPGDTIDFEFEARDPNGEPVQTEGRVELTRERWVEIWTDPDGREVEGAALERARRTPTSFGQGWKLKFRGYEQKTVTVTSVRTDENGEGSWSFEAGEEGYYRVSWRSEDNIGAEILAGDTLFVADENTSDVGYRYGGVDILVDKDTFRSGETVPVMISVPSNDRYVLFTVEGEDLYHYRVVHVTGTVKLLTLDIDPSFVPNVFLGAAMVSDGDTWTDMEEVIVPPVEHFLDVEMAYDREAYEPGETGTIKLTVRDHEGNPVRAELALGVYDDSLSYIQSDLAGDPRQFFFGQKRYQRVMTYTTTSHGRFTRLVRNEKGDVVDEKVARMEQKRQDGSFFNDASGFGGGADRLGSLANGRSLERGRNEVAAKSRANAPAVIGLAGARMPMDEAEMDGDMLVRRSAAGPAGTAAGTGPAVRVRSDFRDTAFWQPDIVTDEDGVAVVEVPFPDNTTRWQGTVRVAGSDATFGFGKASVRTRQPLIARLQAPRFFQVGDEVTVSANLTTNPDAALTVRPPLAVDGLELVGFVVDGVLRPGAPNAVLVPAGGSKRIDWLVRPLDSGQASLRLTAISDEHSDGMERSYPVYPHGIEVFLARAGKMVGDEVVITLDLPNDRKAGTTDLSVQITPSLAVTMLDSLPYLVDYPYGCTEQTLSRFLPAVVVMKTLEDFGMSKEDALEKVFGGIEREFVDKTHSKGIDDFNELDRVVEKGLERLYDFQHSDGGWSWWKAGDSDHWMTAYVVWGLTLADEAGVEVRGGVLERGARYLELEIVEEEGNPDMQAWMLHALARHLNSVERTSDSKFASKAFDNLWERRRHLNAYTRSLFTLAALDLGKGEEARILRDNLANGVLIDDSPDTSVVQLGPQAAHADALKTAHWGEDGIYWRWSDGGVEATAFALRALVAVEPSHELVAPTVNWLVQNRRGAQWSNTRDTAICVLALSDYLR